MAEKTDKKMERASNLCCYSQRVCNLEKLKGFHFCHKHILEDKASPFKPCSFTAKSNGKRCTNPAPKLPDKEKSYCIIHTRKAELRRAVEERRKRKKRNSVDELWSDMEEYRVHSKRRRTTSSTSHKSRDGSNKADFHSSEEEEMSMDPPSGSEELSKVDSAWHGDADSDAESVNSEDEDPLKHAGVWTTEEAVRMCRDKMVRLRSLYIDQFKRLQHVLKEKRRKYLHAIQTEEENEFGECTIPVSQLLGKRRKKVHGAEALLHKQAKERRTNTSTRHQNMPHLRCSHTAEGIRCTDRILPFTKYCLRHINHDPNQVLFEKCSFHGGDNQQCETLVPKAFPHTTCQLHMQLPAHAGRMDVEKDLEDAKEMDRDRKTKALEHKIKSELSISLPMDCEPGPSGDLSAPGTFGETAATLLPAQKLLMPLGPTPPIIGSKLAVLVPPSEFQKEKESVQIPQQTKPIPAETPQETTREKPKTEVAKVVEESASATSSPTGSLSGVDISPSLAAASIIAVCSPQSSTVDGGKCTPSASVLPASTALFQSAGSSASIAAATTTTATSSCASTSSTTSVTGVQLATSSIASVEDDKKTATTIATSSHLPLMTTSSSLMMKDSLQTSKAVTSGDAILAAGSSLNATSTATGTAASSATNIAGSNTVSTAANTVLKSARSIAEGTIAFPPASTITSADSVHSTATASITATCEISRPTVTGQSVSPTVVQNAQSAPMDSVPSTVTASISTSKLQLDSKEELTSVARTLRNVSLLSAKIVSDVDTKPSEAQTPELRSGEKSGTVKVSDSTSEEASSEKQREVKLQAQTSEPLSSTGAQSDQTERNVYGTIEGETECSKKEPEVASEGLAEPSRR